MTSRCSNIPRARIVDICKLQGSLYGLSHDEFIVFSTKLKSSG